MFNHLHAFILAYRLQQAWKPNSLVKKRVYGPRKDFFYLYSDAQYSLKFPARIVLTPLFLTIYVIMTSFPQKLASFF